MRVLIGMPPEPAYRRLTLAEILQVHGWAASGLSARLIAIRLEPSRDHKSVRYWLTSKRQRQLAYRLICDRDYRYVGVSWIRRVGPCEQSQLEDFARLVIGPLPNFAFTMRLLRQYPSPCPVVASSESVHRIQRDGCRQECEPGCGLMDA
jgi:hypothetical protein